MNLEEHLATAAGERQLKYVTKIVDYFPPLSEFPDERIYLGVNSWTLPDRGERWIKPSAVINIGYGIQTGGEIARDYLDWKFPKRLRATGEQARAFKLHRSAPLYVEPAVLEWACYVDLKSAYWSIMNLVGWNVDYNPGKWIVRGTPPEDFPIPNNKPARNSLVSCGLPSPLRMWTGKKITRQFRDNKHINMGLWSFIMDTLHAIAGEARRFGAVYCHTDGYILPAWDSDELIETIRSYGLNAGVKATGVGTVIGMGNFKVGEHMTKFYMRPTSFHGQVDYIYQVNREQIQHKLAKCKANEYIRWDRQNFPAVRE